MATSAKAVDSADVPVIDIDPYLENFAARGPEGRKQRQVLAESVEDLKKSGFMRSLVPSKWGGLEVPVQEFFRAQIKISEADMGTGWIAGVIAVHAFQIALMDEQAQRDVYGDDPDTCVSSSYNPVGGKTEQVDGGVKLSGRWGWSSGSEHCNWVLLGAIIAGEGYRTFLVPRSDYEIEDTWYAMGLQSSGSNDIVIDTPVFVPDYRTHKQMDGFNCLNDQENPMYSMPWAQAFARCVSTPAIGAAKHALQLFIDNASTSSSDPTRLIGDPDILRRVAEVEYLIDEVETLLFRNFDAMTALLEAGEEIPLIDRVRYRYQAGVVITKMMQAVDMLFETAGGRSVFLGSEIQNIWHDIHIARAHVANSPVAFARNLGNMMLGGENQDVFI
ncbi:MAG: flavin-dependent monooxygenase [Gammaproteobacteria bacterium]|nr:flavin-dependent monooxygenase [Gammaproteobacteria bacterium]MDH3371909.1 flavin-dependent monooxygenase [Gammaproteobacteria bacterium]MDH3407762.1 flavin-dependent monooxygenase [Gammaproteobacteria bacterium]MDH3551119.1 flavin-dependent monooxygenase [Gammaproteobacteria bacterium]